MEEMERTSTEKCKSLHFYKYLCRKIGTEEVVRTRRLAFCISDMSLGSRYEKITSGSKGEGLNFKGSDMDTMYIDNNFKVYESETDVIHHGPTIPLIMNTEESQTCFTQLERKVYHESYQYDPDDLKHLWTNNIFGCMLSSEQYKLLGLQLSETGGPGVKYKIHGPCITDTYELFDLAMCLKCDQWIFQAQPWVNRSQTAWPTPEIISKIISVGVLFVPIGCKGSVIENLEWRISFSIAEKFLIYSFSHTQLLCYALLKILLKEIVERHADLKGLLCSYFLKTLMLWISEETDPALWRPDNIIPCFMACLQRLLYYVRYSSLSHYFIPENNLFYSRFNVVNKDKLESILKNLYEQNINCFDPSETIKYYRHIYKITDYVTSENVIHIIQNGPAFCRPGNIMKILYHCLHHSRTRLTVGLFALHLSKACHIAPDASSCKKSSKNKHQYNKYKFDLSHLLIGVNSDAVSGWLRLASFFYVCKNYVASLRVTNYALQKYTDEKIFIGYPTSEITFVQNLKPGLNLKTKDYSSIQKHEINLMKKERLYTAVKTLTIEALSFNSRSLIIPTEIDCFAKEQHFYHPLPYAYFLSFLCYYHLQDFPSCRHYLHQLTSFIARSDHKNYPVLSTNIMCFIAHALIGEQCLARQILINIGNSAPWLRQLCIAMFINMLI